MRDLKSPTAIWVKGMLFLVLGLGAATLLVVEIRSLQGAVLMALAIWGCCRAYYFAFYVIEKYVDPSYRFSGLGSFLRYGLRHPQRPPPTHETEARRSGPPGRDSLKITPMGMDLYDEVMALWRKCEGIGLSDADEAPAISRYLERNPGMSFVARIGDSLAGAVLCGHDGRRGYLHHLAVDPRFRRRGIGSGLVERCMDALRHAGIKKCHLFVLNGNPDGRRFWESIGWAGRDDIRMLSRRLP